MRTTYKRGYSKISAGRTAEGWYGGRHTVSVPTGKWTPAAICEDIFSLPPYCGLVHLWKKRWRNLFWLFCIKTFPNVNAKANVWLTIHGKCGTDFQDFLSPLFCIDKSPPLRLRSFFVAHRKPNIVHACTWYRSCLDLSSESVPTHYFGSQDWYARGDVTPL